MLTEPTSAQRDAFDLIGIPIPLTFSSQKCHSVRPAKRQARHINTHRSGRNFGLAVPKGHQEFCGISDAGHADLAAGCRELVRAVSRHDVAVDGHL